MRERKKERRKRKRKEGEEVEQNPFRCLIQLIQLHSASQTQKITDSFVYEKSGVSIKVIGAQVKSVTFLLEHNIPTTAADHAGPIFCSMLPDSKIASYYGSARTKLHASSMDP